MPEPESNDSPTVGLPTTSEAAGPPTADSPSADGARTLADLVWPAPGGVPPQAAGRFRFLRLHAHGGLGEVYVAHDDELNRRVALKRIRPHVRDDASRRRFLTEAEVTARLEHPGVVPVHGLVTDGEGQPCYAMRFIEGTTLADAITQLHKLPANDPGRRLALRRLLQHFVSRVVAQ